MCLIKKARKTIEEAIQKAITNGIFEESHREKVYALVFEGKTANEVNTKCFDYDQADYIEILVSEYKSQLEGYVQSRNDHENKKSSSKHSHEFLLSTHQQSRGIMFDFSPLDQY
jgi:hypothetical protein